MAVMLTMQIYSEFITINYLSPPIRAERAYEPPVEVSQETYDRHMRIWSEFQEMQEELMDLRTKMNGRPPFPLKIPPVDDLKELKK